MATIETQLAKSKRQLVIHDGLAFLILTAATAILFAITLFLFKSFSAHRADLAHEAGEDGRIALDQGRPRDAITALRTALSYAPNERDYELMLAQALGEDGHTEEATNYFLNLWESQPGDGFLNLQLARLAKQSHRKQTAINYYRASVFGSWNGDGVTHRREVRLELVDYLIEQKEFAAAQAELLIAAGNAPPIPALNLRFGDDLLRAGDPADALKRYQDAIAEDPRNAVAYEHAGRLAYSQGDFVRAREWLELALRESAGTIASAADPEGDTTALLKNAERLVALDPALAPTRNVRIARLLDDKLIAKKRLDACTKQVAASGKSTVPLDPLTARWTAASILVTREGLFRDASNEDTLRGLIDDSEAQAAQLCGAPTGDDALLLLLAKRGQPGFQNN
jgi:tetratricopeptide (TPR) repeat protein